VTPERRQQVTRLRAALTHPRQLVEIIRYGAVGLFNAVLYLGLYTGAIAAGAPYYVAAVASFLVTSSVGYWLHEHFTFQGRSASLSGLAKWLAAQSGATVLNVLLLTVLIHLAGLEAVVAQAILLPFLPAATYLLGRRWVFTRREGPSAAADRPLPQPPTR
jgi:putative flippase GtrA